MTRWSPDQRATLDSIVDEFLQHYARGRTMLAVDGVDSEATARFADQLAERFDRKAHSVARAQINAFQRPRAERFARGIDSVEGAFHDAFDYDVFRRFLVEPFKLGGSTGFVPAIFDHLADAPLELRWETAGPDTTLIVDGVFLNRRELAGLWNYSIWLEGLDGLDGGGGVSTGSTSDGGSSRERGAIELYLAEADPCSSATAIIDNTDPSAPRRVFADSC